MTKEEQLMELLREAKNALDGHNVRFWLECGTLLGAVRDGTFIPWEKDIDFSAWRHEVSEATIKSIANNLRDKGFSVWVAQSHMNVRNEGQCHLDINFYEIHDDKAVMPAYMPGNLLGKILNIWIPSLTEPNHPRDINKLQAKTTRIMVKSSVSVSKFLPAFIRNGLAKVLFTIYKRFGAKDISWVVPAGYFSDFSAMDFYGLEFKVPANVEAYVEFRYGKDWRTPTQDWVHHEDDGACHEPAMAMISK